MQSVSSRIWTCVAVSISYDDNHYTIMTDLTVFYLMISYSWQKIMIELEN